MQNQQAEHEENENSVDRSFSPKSKDRKRHRESPDLSDRDRRKPGRKPGQGMASF